MAKLPFIPDKALYAAVMGACSYVRNTGYFNKACRYYADKYDVDVDEVAKYVRIAQSNGQKKAANKKPRKYRWFAIEYSLGNERNGCDYFEILCAQYEVRKGLTVESVKRTMCRNDDDANEYAAVHWFGRCEAFSSEEEAVNKCKIWIAEAKRWESLNIST